MQKIRPLVSDLNLGVRQTAIMSLGLRSQDFPKNLAILTPMVTDTDWRIRQTAITALGSSAIEYPKVKQLFLDVVADPLQPQICRQNAMLSLSQTKDLEIKSLLVSTLNSPDWRMRQVATFGLGNFKEIDLAPPLRLAIQDPYWPVRQAGVASIGGIGSATTAMPELLPLLNDPSWEVRLTTLACLNTFKEDLTTQTLLTSLKDEHPEIRCLAVSSLADRVNEIGVSQSLVDLMSHDGSPSVRSQAALSLKGISDLNSTSALVTALSDPFPRVRNSAMLSLAPIAGLDINRRMQSLVSDRNLSVSQTAILSLGLKSADFPENVDLLMPKLTDMNWQTRQIAMASLGGNISRFTQLKQPFVDVMGDESQPFSLRQTAMLSLTATGDLQMKSRLLDDLDNPDWRMRQTATLGLGSLKDMSTLPSLQRLTTDPYWGVRQSVAASLSNFGDTTVVKNLSPLLRDSNWQVRCSAAASFSSFDTTLKSKALSPLLNDSNRLVREAAARSMGTSIPTIPRTLSMDSSQGMVNYMLSDIRDWQTSAIQAEYMQRLEMKDLGNAAIAASYGIDVGRLYQSFSDASITSPLLASLRLMTKVGAQSGVEDRRADSDTANRRLTYVSLGLNGLGRSYVGIGCTALARDLNYWGTSARIQASESLWTTTNCRFSNSDGYLSMTGSMFVKTTFTPAANSGLFQGGVFHEGTTVRQSSASYTVRQGGSFSTPYQSYYVHNERNFGSGSRWTYNQFGSGLNNYGSGLNNYVSGLNNYGSGLNNYGSGLNNYGSGLNNYGSGLNNYGSGLNNYGSGLNNYGSGLNNYGSGLNSSYNR
jgi:HEAT repeat protein